MTQKYYVDQNGKYIGSFDGVVPENATEVTIPPSNGHTWKSGQWEAPSASVAEVKEEAGRRILEKLPSWQQSNLIAREAELIATDGGHLRDINGVKLPARDLTNDEVAELVYIKALWDWVKSVRVASGVIEQSPPKKDKLPTDSRWPADPA